MFEVVQHSYAWQKVVDQIEEAILSERLQAGERLPSERKLTETFKTSRLTLREAMRVLEQKGLLEIKTGSKGGAFVTDHSFDRMAESLSLLIRKKKLRYESLVEFRRELEGDIAALAAERASPGELRALKALLQQTERLARQGLAAGEQFNALETKLHLHLGRLCRNPLYEVILGSIHEVLVSPSFKFLAVDEAYLLQAYQDWVQIAKAVERKQTGRARALMQEHLSKFSRYHRRYREFFDGRGWHLATRAAGAERR